MPYLLICRVIALYFIDSKDGCAVRQCMPASNKVTVVLVASEILFCHVSGPHHLQRTQSSAMQIAKHIKHCLVSLRKALLKADTMLFEDAIEHNRLEEHKQKESHPLVLH